jgi:MinD-like ATPase involved in chromosome partitioning or flagellar assembly
MTDLEELRKAAEKAVEIGVTIHAMPQTILSLIGEIKRLRGALQRARPFVSDAINGEDREASVAALHLLLEIDADSEARRAAEPVKEG